MTELGGHRSSGVAADAAPALLVGASVVLFGFQGGGFFPASTALVAVALLGLLFLRLMSSERPFAGFGTRAIVCAGCLGLFTAWTLFSSTWSGAEGRALLEYDRALMYSLAFVVFAAGGYTPRRMRWLVRGLVAGIFIVCLCALATRLAPDVWEVSTRLAPERLSYPLTYWNALGLLAAIGVVLAFAQTCDLAETRAVRIVAAAAIPVLAATLLLTFSRGAIAACAVGVATVVLVGRPGALFGGMLAAGPAAAVAVAWAHGANLLGTETPTTAAAAAQGHDVALVVALCTVGSAAVRAGLLRLDARLVRVDLTTRVRRPIVVVAAVAAMLSILFAAFGAGAWASIERQYERFVEGDALAHTEQRARLTDPGNNGRLDFWHAAVDAFEAEPIHGHGAGTFALEWDRRRPLVDQAEDAHSLYLEVLAELGVIGLLLLGGAVLLLLAGLLTRARGPDRVVGGGLFAAGLAWGLHAGVDWDWEMPAVTLWVFAAGGVALAASRISPAAGMPISRIGRVASAIGCLLIAVVPARVVLAERPLEDSREAFAAGDCQRAIDRALDSIAILSALPDPYVVLGYCDVRVGLPRLGVEAVEKAVSRDPKNWEFHYGLALVRAASGLDPRPAARRALELNPREQLARDAAKRFATGDPRTWRRRALSARLPVE